MFGTNLHDIPIPRYAKFDLGTDEHFNYLNSRLRVIGIAVLAKWASVVTHVMWLVNLCLKVHKIKRSCIVHASIPKFQAA